MRYLGIDYGTKKVGIAISDESGTMAFPREVLPNDGNLLTHFVQLITKEHIEAIVIGHSKHPDGSDNPLQEGVNALMQGLTLETALPIYLEPEQYTSQEAMRIQGRTPKTDASAAAIILNSYLTRNK